MRRNLLELLRNPVNTGVAIGLLIGLAYLEFSASAQATRVPETRDARCGYNYPRKFAVTGKTGVGGQFAQQQS